MSYPPPPEFVAFLDANPGTYRNNPEPDGYNPTDEINAALVHRPDVANPDPQQDVPAPFSIQDAQALLSSESMGKLSDTWWTSFAVAIADNRNDAKSFVINAEHRADILPDESTAIQAGLDATVPDPDWSATVKGDSDAMTQWGMSGWSAAYTDNALGR